MGSAVALPTSSDPTKWSAEEAALVEAAGLVQVERNGDKSLAPRPVVAAFLQHAQRTGLDPFARQIYCIARKSRGQVRWQTQVSIDGARLVAERSGQYRGQTPVEWTADGVTWTQVWLSADMPRAARVGVYREGFAEPLIAVATWDSYAVYEDEWKGGQKTGNKKLSAMWAKFGPLMLGKCAEMLALRKAFPMELSGLYSTEEMDQAGTPAKAAVEATPPATVDPSWLHRLDEATFLGPDEVGGGGLRALFKEVKQAERETGQVILGARVDVDDATTFGDLLMKKSATLPEQAEDENVVDAEVVEDEPATDPATGEVTGETVAEDAEAVTEWPTAKIPDGDVA